jgi:actin-related protein
MTSDPILVIDFDSVLIKAGFASNDAPSLLFPFGLGKVRLSLAAGSAGTEPLIGEAAQTSPDVILTRPIERGILVHLT